MCFRPDLSSFASALVFVVLLVSSDCVFGQNDFADWPAGVLAREKLSSERSYDYEFADISVSTLQTWLGRIGVELPIELDGDLAGWVWVQRSKDGWFDFSNYRVEGEVSSPELKIDNWSVNEAKVRFGFAGGNWYVGELAGVLQSPSDQSQIGIASANAKILTATTSLIELDAKIDHIDLRSLLQSFGIDIGMTNSKGSVLLKGKSAIANASDLSKWEATSVLKLDDVAVPWIELPGRVFAQVALTDGAWKLTKGRVAVAGQDLTLAATGRLDAGLPFELSLSGRNIDTNQLLHQLKQQEFAEQMRGAIKLDAKANGSQAKGIESATAAVQSDRLIVREQAIKQLTVRAGYTPGELQLNVDSAIFAGGTVSGNAAWPDLMQVARGIPATARLDVKDLDLEQLVWLDLPVQVRGRATGQVEFATEARDKMHDWSSAGSLQIVDLEAAGTSFGLSQVKWNKNPNVDELAGTVSVSRGKGYLEADIETKLEDRPGSLLRATAPIDYRAKGQLKDYVIVARYDDAPSKEIPIRAIGSFDVSGTSANWLERGSAQFSHSAAMWGDRMLTLESADLSFTADEFRLERFRLLDPNGRVAGAAIFRRDNVGEHLLRLRVVDVEINPYLSSFVPGELSSLGGVLAIELELRKDATSNNLFENWNGQWRGNLHKLSFKGQPIGQLDLSGNIVERILSAEVVGQLLGGVANAKLRFPMSILDEQPSAGAEPGTLQLQLGKLQVKQLAALFFQQQNAAGFDGTATVQLSVEGSSADDLAITTKIDMPMLMQNRRVLAREIKAALRFSANTLLVDRVSGGFAGGRIDARGQLQFGNEGSSQLISGGKINFVARRLDASSIVAIADPAYAEYFSGAVNYQGTATFHRGIQMRGIATVNKGDLLGFPIQVARGEVRTELSPEFEFRQLVSNDLHGTAIGGPFAAELAIKGGNHFALKTSGQVTRGKLEQLSQALGFQQIVGSGTFNGNFALQSQQIESLNAITGGLRIDFEGGDVKSIPIISSLERFVPLAQFASANIESGRLDAKLGQGQLRIIELILTSKAFVLAASGSASLDATKLDIDAAIQTGGGIQQRLAQNAIDLWLLGSVPQLAAITELNELIRNRSLFVHIGGSPSIPVIQAKTGQTAAKVFLQNFGRGQLGATPLGNTPLINQ